MQTVPVTPQPQAALSKQDELILVVKRRDLFPNGAWHGLRAVDYATYAELIQAKKEFLPRSLMEQDPVYKQIIPYLVFTHKGKYFLMQRHAKLTETRLTNKYTLGIGGHIRAEDLTDNDIASWAQREFREEIDFAGNCVLEPLGILNDDSNAVGQVHVGFVFLVHGDTDAISVRSELKSGQLLPLDGCDEYYAFMETWSQIVIDHLKTIA